MTSPDTGLHDDPAYALSFAQWALRRIWRAICDGAATQGDRDTWCAAGDAARGLAIEQVARATPQLGADPDPAQD